MLQQLQFDRVVTVHLHSCSIYPDNYVKFTKDLLGRFK
jgi:hypothetical protein